MKKLFIAALTMALVFSGCAKENGTGKAESKASSTASVSQSAPLSEAAQSAAAEPLKLQGEKLMVYCGAGMKKPFSDIAEAFKAETGCEMEINFANAAQIQTQINTAKEGDMFIAGSAEELKPVKELVAESKDLVKHIPVLAVQKGNPKNIKSVADLASKDIRLLLGDAQATPIGKIGDKILKDFAIFDKVNLIARTTTAPAIVTALAADECDAAIVWKENTGDAAEIIATEDMDKYVKTVPAATLTCHKEGPALADFYAYLDTDAAKAIWQKYGYEVLN
ncbi:MAG: molybdate ABC transporter substrate-binding protein [Oscillospiraceae bacterium]